MISIRQAINSDLGLLSEIGMQTFSDSFGKENTPSNMQTYLEESFNRNQIKKELGEKDTRFFLAFDETTSAGYAKVRHNPKMNTKLGENAIELQRIYVVRNYLGKQVGASLMQFCLDYAIKNKFEWMWLGVWEKNLRAHKFYERWGFEKFGEQIFQMGDDPQTDWLMRRKLAS